MKTILGTTLASLIILSVSCTKESLQKPLSAMPQSENIAIASAAHFIGERFGGGIVFYINTAGTHGLIADTVDLPLATWYNGIYTVTGVTATDIGTGKANTNQIISLQGRSGNYAALECRRSKRSGFTDWFLPSRDELSQIYLQLNIIPNLVLSNYYWSSSEIHDSSVFSWGVYFFSGVQYANAKNYIGNVRAVRSF